MLQFEVNRKNNFQDIHKIFNTARAVVEDESRSLKVMEKQ